MLEDNPFYTVEFVENEDDTTDTQIDEAAVDNPASLMNQEVVDDAQQIKNQSEQTEERELNIPTKDAVQTPEVSEETKPSTGVSSYIEIPDIMKETATCKSDLTSIIDKFNFILVFATLFLVIIKFKKKKLDNIIEKITNVISKHPFVIGVIGLTITLAIFSYPKTFGTGISGKIDLFTMIEFAAFIIINSTTLTFITLTKAKEKNIIFKNKRYSFAGINFLEKSLLTFSFTSLLFFFFTESQIAVGILYIFTIFTSMTIFIQNTREKNEAYKNFIPLTYSLELALLGALSGIYIIILISAILAGYYFPDAKRIFYELKKGGK